MRRAVLGRVVAPCCDCLHNTTQLDVCDDVVISAGIVEQ